MKPTGDLAVGPPEDAGQKNKVLKPSVSNRILKMKVVENGLRYPNSKSIWALDLIPPKSAKAEDID